MQGYFYMVVSIPHFFTSWDLGSNSERAASPRGWVAQRDAPESADMQIYRIKLHFRSFFTRIPLRMFAELVLRFQDVCAALHGVHHSGVRATVQPILLAAHGPFHCSLCSCLGCHLSERKDPPPCPPASLRTFLSPIAVSLI
jgi:hypothetical protein